MACTEMVIERQKEGKIKRRGGRKRKRNEKSEVERTSLAWGFLECMTDLYMFVELPYQWIQCTHYFIQLCIVAAWAWLSSHQQMTSMQWWRWYAKVTKTLKVQAILPQTWVLHIDSEGFILFIVFQQCLGRQNLRIWVRIGADKMVDRESAAQICTGDHNSDQNRGRSGCNKLMQFSFCGGWVKRRQAVPACLGGGFGFPASGQVISILIASWHYRCAETWTITVTTEIILRSICIQARYGHVNDLLALAVPAWNCRRLTLNEDIWNGISYSWFSLWR